MKKLIILPEREYSPNIGLKRLINIIFKARSWLRFFILFANPLALFRSPGPYHQKGKYKTVKIGSKINDFKMKIDILLNK